MSSLQEKAARLKIKKILSILGISTPGQKSIKKLLGGKLYELFVLSELLLDLSKTGYTFLFSSNTINFKTSGGPIKLGDFHVKVINSKNKTIGLIYTDVEVRTLGWKLGSVSDLSQYHEIDVVVVKPNTTGYPEPTQLLLGIECKATAKFLKSHVREALGRRRELSMYNGPFPVLLHPLVSVMANPPSEYWLCFIDPAGKKYIQSPAVFSVDLKHWMP